MPTQRSLSSFEGEQWLEKHKDHCLSFNEQGTQTYTVNSIQDGVVSVDANPTDGYVDHRYLYCEDCYDKPDAVGPAPREVEYE